MRNKKKWILGGLCALLGAFIVTRVYIYHSEPEKPEFEIVISKNKICKDLDQQRGNFNRYCRDDFQRVIYHSEPEKPEFEIVNSFSQSYTMVIIEKRWNNSLLLFRLGCNLFYSIFTVSFM